MLKPGELVGPYEIRGFLGQGGMGKVYRAFDPRLERTVALKIITALASSSAGASAGSSNVHDGKGSEGPRNDSAANVFGTRLLREARAVASLNHPNVVAIFDVGESEGRLYLAMEYVVGSPLRDFVGDLEIPLARRVRWLIDVARALEAAHQNGIVHRDIKPENVMIREDGGVKVLDFGIARRNATRGRQDQEAIDTVTGGGSIAGTPVYMAPEQIKGGDVDARCDQFAWGVMAYELLTGSRPWIETGDVLSLVANILTEAPKSIREHVKEVPAAVEETIFRALSKDPGQRFPSMAAVADVLEAFAMHGSSSSTPNAALASGTSGEARVRITPATPPPDDAAYAATTRVPTTVSVAPPTPGPETVPTKRRALSLAAPLVLLGALGAAVYLVKTRPIDNVDPRPTPVTSSSAPRPLSTVPAAETTYKDAMRLWHDGASAKARTTLAHAIELDPTFAAAYLERAIQEATANDLPTAQAAFQSAYEHRQLLLARDSALLEASEPFIRPSPDVEEWETRMTAVVFQHPRDPELQFYLGRARLQQGENESAKQAFVAAVRLDEGFVPGLAAIAKVEKNLGNVAEGLATTERCIKRSPVAATCVETRYELLFAAGECSRAKDEATNWSSLEPQSPRPFGSLARALHAAGAPRPSVEEVLGRRWSLVPAEDRTQAEMWDRALLAVLDGDFAKADDLARQYDSGLPVSADAYDHSGPARLRVNVLMESDRMKDAAKVARSFLDRLPAWTVYPFAPDPSLTFEEPLYRAGEITKKELDDKRAEWLKREQRRAGEGRSPREPWTAWASVYGSFAETHDEAAEALAHLPHEKLPGAGRRNVFLDFALGKAYALFGRWDDAIPHLERVVGSCDTFDAAMVIAKARLYLAQAREAKNEMPAARAMYSKIVDTWPKGSPSKTLKKASERLSALPKKE